MFSLRAVRCSRNFRTVRTEKVLCVSAKIGLFARNHPTRAVVLALVRAIRNLYKTLVAGRTPALPGQYSKGSRTTCFTHRCKISRLLGIRTGGITVINQEL